MRPRVTRKARRYTRGEVGFSVKTAVLVLVVGAILVGAFSLHRLQGSHPNCHYRNWDAPCRTSGFHVNWTDISALGGVVVVAIAAGFIRGSRKRKPRPQPRRVAAQPQSSPGEFLGYRRRDQGLGALDAHGRPTQDATE